MTEQTRETILQQAQNEAYVSLKSYMRQQYYYCEEDWDEELPYIKSAYIYRLKNSLLEAGKEHRLDTTKMLEKASAMSDTVVKRVIDDYEKERITYSIVSASCENALQELLDRHKALFEIDIVTFSPDKFCGYVTLKDNTNVYTSYPTTVETIYEDTATALNQLK